MSINRRRPGAVGPAVLGSARIRYQTRPQSQTCRSAAYSGPRLAAARAVDNGPNECDDPCLRPLYLSAEKEMENPNGGSHMSTVRD